MSELATLSLFLLAVAAVIASFTSFTSVERRIISAIRTTKALFNEASFFKKTLNTITKGVVVNFIAQRMYCDLCGAPSGEA